MLECVHNRRFRDWRRDHGSRERERLTERERERERDSQRERERERERERAVLPCVVLSRWRDRYGVVEKAERNRVVKGGIII